VPVSYEAGGRQYFLMISSAGGGRGGGRGAAVQPVDKNPVGAIAFALPRKDSNNNGETASRSVK
jgi:hypothetical protein